MKCVNEGGTESRYPFAKPACPYAFFSDRDGCHLVRFVEDRMAFRVMRKGAR
jgi:hypothetical protein